MLLSTFTLLLALVIILAGTLAFVITRGAGQNVEGPRKCFFLYLCSSLLTAEKYGIWKILSGLDAQLEKLEELKKELTHNHTHSHPLADFGRLSKKCSHIYNFMVLQSL